VPLATFTVIGCTGDRPALFSAGSEFTVATGGTIVGVALVVLVGTLGPTVGVLCAGWLVAGAAVAAPVGSAGAGVEPGREAGPAGDADVEDASVPGATVIGSPAARLGLAVGSVEPAAPTVLVTVCSDGPATATMPVSADRSRRDERIGAGFLDDQW